MTTTRAEAIGVEHRPVPQRLGERDARRATIEHVVPAGRPQPRIACAGGRGTSPGRPRRRARRSVDEHREPRRVVDVGRPVRGEQHAGALVDGGPRSDPERAQRVGDGVADDDAPVAGRRPRRRGSGAARSVGAKCSDASAAAVRRCDSSSERGLNERSPASTCTTGTPNRRAASANSGTVCVSPSSSTASGRSRGELLVRRR